MAKITLDKAEKIDIIARKDNNFSVTFSISDEENVLEVFTPNSVTSQVYISADNEVLSNASNRPVSESIYKNAIEEDVMLFTITTDDGTPILAACSSQLDMAMFRSTLGLENNLSIAGIGISYQNQSQNTGFTFGEYRSSSVQKTFDKFLTKQHFNKIKGVAKILSHYSNKNTLEEKSNYFTDNIEYYHSSALVNGGGHLLTDDAFNESGLTLDMRLTNSNDKEIWFYNIFTNQESLHPLNYVEGSSWFNYLPSTGNQYIFWGEVTGTNPFTVNFDSSRFNLKKGSYKYTFRALSDFEASENLHASLLDEDITGASEHRVFKSARTLMYGKLKVKD